MGCSPVYFGPATAFPLCRLRLLFGSQIDRWSDGRSLVALRLSRMHTDRGQPGVVLSGAELRPRAEPPDCHPKVPLSAQPSLDKKVPRRRNCWATPIPCSRAPRPISREQANSRPRSFAEQQPSLRRWRAASARASRPVRASVRRRKPSRDQPRCACWDETALPCQCAPPSPRSHQRQWISVRSPLRSRADPPPTRAGDLSVLTLGVSAPLELISTRIESVSRTTLTRSTRWAPGQPQLPPAPVATIRTLPVVAFAFRFSPPAGLARVSFVQLDIGAPFPECAALLTPLEP